MLKFVKRKGLTNSGLEPKPNMPNVAEAQLSKGDRISCWTSEDVYDQHFFTDQKLGDQQATLLRFPIGINALIDGETIKK